MADGKFILLHGFSREELSAVMRAARSAVKDPADIAFAVTTEANADWKVRDLVREVTQEHEYMKNNPPPGKGQGPGQPPPGGQER
jgi:hypothetical protein